jgi:hypothetical protein
MYRAELIPRWVWVLLTVSGLLILAVAISMAVTRPRNRVVVGPEVKAGNPRDFLQPPPIMVTPAPAPSATVTPTPAPQAAVPPKGLPQSFAFEGQTWQFSSGPVQIEVLTTGEYADNHIIYSKQNDKPPYDALYLESKPNSGRFYKYIPANQQTVPTPSG